MLRLLSNHLHLLHLHVLHLRWWAMRRLGVDQVPIHETSPDVEHLPWWMRRQLVVDRQRLAGIASA